MMSTKSCTDTPMKSLVNFLSPHVAPVQKVTVPPETRCAFDGVPLRAGGVLLKSIIKPATANIADTFKYPSDFISPAVAACFKAQRELRGNLYVTEEAIARPLFSITSAAETGRPSWLSVLLDILNFRTAAHQETLATQMTYCFILTDEAKRRLWPAAVTTQIGETFDIYYNVGTVSRVIRLKTFLFRCLLEICTFLLTQGFHRLALEKTLMASEVAYATNKIRTVSAIEKQLCKYRGTPTFQVAAYVARDLRELPDDDSHRQYLLPSFAYVRQRLLSMAEKDFPQYWTIEMSDGTLIQIPANSETPKHAHSSQAVIR